MPKIKMLEKMSSYRVTYLADKPGEIDAKYMGGNESRKKAEGHEGWDGW